ncbi:AMP-dependent synthetase and ligase [Truepera radiovictrix DSM 17093]|uniref:AMP-dependent synthetase and ligase n=1 Tax=Truepera radiovictrix (strain DSM 17093 / CIP 108686 / LMG 22925 / RQ-24) TaxID=649638 RepID=D7CSP9_TRURR|nr:AMP-dependent synthetase and ligase [Truepera radiovictrix DSM 17093]
MGVEVIEKTPDKTLPQLLLERAARAPKAVALRHKHFGVWQERTWGEVESEVRRAALGLLSLGVVPGDRVAVLADNIPEWLLLELAAQSLGAMTVGIYASSSPDEVDYLLSYTEASVLLAEDQEQVDKVLGLRERLPHLKKVIVEDPRGMRAYLEDPWFITWSELLRLGEALGAREPELFRAHVAQGNPDDICHLSTTSGTTGRPKAAMLSHRNYLAMATALHQVDPIASGDDYVSYLPFAWIVEQVFAVALPLLTGMVVNFPEDSETAMSDLKEIGPHMMLGAPRVWEGVQAAIWVKISESYTLNRWVYRRLMRVGERAAAYRMRGERLPWGLALAYRLAHALLFRPLKDQLGFLRLRRAYTGGAALGPDTFTFFQGIGVNLKQVYGQTETAGLAYVQPDGDIRPDTVGVPLPGVEVRISEAGEVLTRCAGVCHGYFRRPEAFEETITEDGFFRSGDAGYLDERGHLVIIDRVSDVMHTESGHMFSPQAVENKLKFSPFIKEAVVYGGGKPFLTAMINIDPLTVGTWAEERGISYTTYMDLSQLPAVGELITGEVERANETLRPEERVHRFVLLYKLLDADDEELTRTGKVRRKVIAERYKALLEALYDPARTRVPVSAEFRYQDGQRVRFETEVTVYAPRAVGSLEPREAVGRSG